MGWKNKPPFRLCLNKAAGEEIIWHCKHYTGRGVMKYYDSGTDLAKDMGVPLKTLEENHEQHYQASLKAAKDPEGGQWPAYPSGNSWDPGIKRAILCCDYYPSHTLLYGRVRGQRKG